MYQLDQDKVPANVIGSKAYRLGQVASFGHLVPLSAIISTEETAQMVGTQEVSDHVFETIRHLRHSDGTFSVMIRSSAFGEDSGEHSWAGQFRSIHCDSLATLKTVLLECANATESESVKAYAETHGLEVPPLALLVQLCIEATFSGVLFTFNPVTGGNRFAVEYVRGHGEDLMSGRVTPHRAFIDPRTGSIEYDNGGEELPESLVRGLVHMGNDLKQRFGVDQDIEFGYVQEIDALFTFQSRDITTAVPEVVDLEEITPVVQNRTAVEFSNEQSRLGSLGISIPLDVLADQNIAEILTPEPSPMALALFAHIFAHGEGAIRKGRNQIGYEIGSELDTGFFSLVGGEPRCSIVHDALTYRIAGISLPEYQKLLDWYLAKIQEDPTRANYPELQLYDENPSMDTLVEVFGQSNAARIRGLYDNFHQRVRTEMEGFATHFHDTFLKRWNEFISFESQRHVVTVEEHVLQYMSMCEMLRESACVEFVKAARFGFFSYGQLRNVMIDNYGEAEGDRLTNELTSGISPDNNPNLQFNIDLAALRDGLIEVSDMVSRYGHLASVELEPAIHRHSEDEEVFRRLASRMVGNPQDDLDRSHDRYTKARELVLSDAGESSSSLEELIEQARTFLPLREVAKFEYLRAYAILRGNALALGNLLGFEEGLIFYLEPEEVFTLDELDDTSRMMYVAQRRRAKQRSCQGLYVPQVISTNDLSVIGTPPATSSDSTYIGTGLSQGSVVSRAVVVRSMDDVEAIEQLKPGDILVTTTTDPAWSPILAIIGKDGGIVTEIGGTLGHGSIYAREVGIPGVGNVWNATNLIKTGDRIRINGRSGVVERVS